MRHRRMESQYKLLTTVGKGVSFSRGTLWGIVRLHLRPGVSQVVLVVKNSPANARDLRDTGSIPGLGRSPGGGHGNPLKYSCLKNPMDKGAWRATVHRISKGQM